MTGRRKTTPDTYEDLLLDKGIDLKNRVIYFGVPATSESSDEDNDFGDFTNLSTEMVIRGIHILENQNRDLPISLYLCSRGGDIYATLKLIDVIKNSPCQIKFYGTGLIASAGTITMVCCDERYLYPNSTVLIHEGSCFLQGKVSDVIIDNKEQKRINDIIYKIFEENSIMPYSFWEKIGHRDLMISANEAISLGLADGIIPIPNKKHINIRKNVNLSIKRDEKDFSLFINNMLKRIEMDSKKYKQTTKEYNNKEIEDNIKNQIEAEISESFYLSIENNKEDVDGK